MKIIDQWRSMPYADKAEFVAEADKLRKESVEKKQKLLAQLSKEEEKELMTRVRERYAERRQGLATKRLRKAKREEQRPKKPASAFILWTKTLDRGDASLADFVKGASRKWNALAKEDKQKFEMESKQKLDKFKAELQVWEAKMLAEGKKKLVSKAFLKKMEKTMAKPKLFKKKPKSRVSGLKKKTAPKKKTTKSTKVKKVAKKVVQKKRAAAKPKAVESKAVEVPKTEVKESS